jgi:hypothetical protein
MRRNRYLFIFAALLLCLGSARAQWQLQPPDYVDLDFFAADSSGTQCLAAPDGGFWRQSGTGLWQDLHGSVLVPHYYPENSLTITAILTPTAALDSIYVLNSDSRFYASVDHGATWTERQDLDGHRAISIWRRDHRVWFDMQSYHFRRSEDYGQTWSFGLLIGNDSYASTIYQDPAHDSTLFVTCGYSSGTQDPGPGGLLRSDDLGQTWRYTLPLSAQLGVDAAIVPQVLRTPDGTLLVYAFTYGYSNGGPWPGGALLASTDDGQTWSVRSTFAKPVNDEARLVATRVPGRLFMPQPVPSGIARSDDNGATWSAAAGLPPLLTKGALLYRQPQSGDLYASSTAYGVQRSTDDGTTWQFAPAPPLGNPCRFALRGEALFCLARHDSRYEEEFLRTAGTGQWSRLTPLPAFGDTMWAENLPLARHGSNLTVLQHVTYTAPDYQHYSWNYFARSTDNGTNWSLDSASFPTRYFNLTDVSVLETAERSRWLIRSSSDRWLYRSVDDGHTWTATAALCDSCYPLQTWQSEEQILTLGFRSGSDTSRLFTSIDEGASWQDLPMPDSFYVDDVQLRGMDIFGPRVTDNKLLHFAHGAWQTPTALPPPPPNSYTEHFLTLIPIPENEALLFCHYALHRALYRSRDDGATWDTLAYQLPGVDEFDLVYGPTYEAASNRLWLASEYGPFWASLDAIASGEEPIHFHPADYSVLSCYPNPFNSSTRIRYDLLQPGQVELKLYDLQGRLVQTLVDEVASAGKHEVRFDGSGLASGTYFVRLHGATQTRTEKLLLLK